MSREKNDASRKMNVFNAGEEPPDFRRTKRKLEERGVP
jgi:hypothetical protein